MGSIDRYEPQTAGHPFLLVHTAGRNKKKKRLGRHHSLLQTPDSKDKQLFNYLCIRIPIDRLKKASSPWQQTSHSLYHRLPVCKPAESHPCGTEANGGEGRGGEVSYPRLSSVFANIIFSSCNAPSSLRCSSSHTLVPSPNVHTLVISFSHTSSYPLINPHVLPPYRQTLLSLAPLLTLSSKLSTYLSNTPPSSPPSCLTVHLYSPAARPGSISKRARSMAGSPSVTGNYTAEQQLPLKRACETGMQKL